MNILVTGGAGYIGSHAAIRLIDDGHRVVVVDNLVKGHRGAIEALTGVSHRHPARFGGGFRFVEMDVADAPALASVMEKERIDAVMHFAALAEVGESVHQPTRYFRVNVGGTLGVVGAMEIADVRRLVFSSTCSTYGQPGPSEIPLRESCPQSPINPYGRSKLACEWVIRDHLEARRMRGAPFAAAMLRYFNVAGADRQSRIGEDHRPETHLVPICLEAALGQREHVTIFGGDYATPDGTCIRDYVHVEDLVDAHVTALNSLDPAVHDCRAFNLGIGRGYSVREVIEAAKRVTGVDFNVIEGPRRPGDPSALYADPRTIQTELGWKARAESLDAIVEDAWRWKRSNPGGYG